MTNRDATRGERIPPTLHLGHVTLQVADLDQSLGYFQRVLGLRVHSRNIAGAMLGIDDARAPLVELVERKGVHPVPAHGRLGLYHYAILLPDRASLGRFAAHLARLGEQVGAADHLVSEALYLRDPDGLGIEVYADRPRDTWRTIAGEMQMASNPLDLTDLVQHAAGTSWNGMPAGTRMGHVHLHVGDLAEAARFYGDALGLDATVWSYPGALFLAAGGYHHHLGLNTWARNAPVPTLDDARLLEWRMTLPATEARAAAERIRDAGYHASEDGPDWRVTDPWGCSLRLVAGTE